MADAAEFDGFSGPDGRPTRAEALLIEASAQGAIANCEDLAEDQRVVSADLLVALATASFRHRDWSDWSLAATGVRVSGIRVDEPVNLESRQIPGDLLFAACIFEGGIDLDNARLDGRLYLGHSTVRGGLRLVSTVISRQVEAPQARFESADGNAVVAQGASTGGWMLDGAIVQGGMNLCDVRIAGHFVATGASFERPGGEAIFAPGVVSSGWFLNQAALKGRLTLARANLGGNFSAIGATFENPDGAAINAEDIVSGPWVLSNAILRGRVDLDNARLGGAFLALTARFEAPGGDALRVRGIEASSFCIDESAVIGRLYLFGAKIAHQFSANGARFENPEGVAIGAQEASASGWFMKETTVRGLMDVNAATIRGQFIASRSTFDNAGGMAIWAQNVVATAWYMTETTVRGRFDVNGATIRGPFDATASKLQNPGGDAFAGHTLQALSCWFDRVSVEGGFDLNHARIEGQFNAEHASFDNAAGVAVSAFSVQVRHWLMSDSVVNGGLDVSRGEFLGVFGAERARFRFPAGTAIDAQSARFHGGVYLRAGTEVWGGVDFTGAGIEQVLDLSESVWRAARYRAVRIQQATIRGEVVFRKAVVYGHVHANRVHVEGRVDFRECTIVAATLARARGDLPDELGEAVNAADEERQYRFRDHAIALQEARIDGRLVMPDRCPEGIVDLSRARCDTLEDSASGWPAPLQPRADACETRICVPASEGEGRDVQHLVLDGFEYQFFEYPSGSPGGDGEVATARGNWLAGQSVNELHTHFNPQPWRQAAIVLRSMGYDEAAQDLAIQRRVRQRLSASTPWRKRIVSWLLHLVADYGFNPWKTVGISVACVIVFALLFSGLTRLCGGYGMWSDVEGSCGDMPIMVAVQHASLDPDVADRAYPRFDPILYSLDMFVPIMDLGSEGFWRANTRAHALIGATHVPVGWILAFLVVLERFLGAILIAIAVTGFTGLLTRDEK